MANSNPMKVITGPRTRWSYVNAWEPKSINGGTPKYSVSLLIPKDDTVTVGKIEKAIQAAYKEGEARISSAVSVSPMKDVRVQANGAESRAMVPNLSKTLFRV